MAAAVVIANKAIATTGTSVTITGLTATAGSAIIATVASFLGTQTTTSITVTRTGDTYTSDSSGIENNGTNSRAGMAILSAPNVGTGANDLVASSTNASGLDVFAVEVSGLPTSAINDATSPAIHQNGTGTAPTSSALSNVTANAIYIALLATESGANPATVTIGGGWSDTATTTETELNGSVGQVAGAGWLVVSSIASRSAAWTTDSIGSGALIAVYKAAGGAATQSATIAPARIANRNVGPAALRYSFRQPPWPFAPDQGPVTDTNFGPPMRIANPRVGPPALRRQWRPPYLPFPGATGAQTFNITVSATVGTTVTLVRAVSLTRSVSAVSTSVTVVRGVAKSIAAGAVAVGVTVVRSVGKLVSTSAVATSVTQAKQVNRTLTPTAVVTGVTLTKQIRRTVVAAAVSTAVTVGKSVGRIITAAPVAITTTMTSGRAFLRTITVGVSTGVTVARQVGKPITIAVTASPTVARAVRLTVAVPVAAGISVAKQIGHTIAVAVGIVTSEQAGRAYVRTLNVVVNVAVAVTFTVISAPVPPNGTLPRVVREWVPGGLRWTRIQM